MNWLTVVFVILRTLTNPALGAPLSGAPSEPDPALAFTVQLDNLPFVNKGLVAFGLIPSNFTESTGDTLGGIGSAIALKLGSFQQRKDGGFTGTLVVQPDRGFNVDTTINYQGRQHEIDFILNPYYSSENLTFTQAQETLQLQYKKTLLYTDRRNVKTSGLDTLGVRPAEFGFPFIAVADPVMPIPNSTFSHLSMDNEGLVLNKDGTFWVSDEYGPYIYRFDSSGGLMQTIQPPEAIVPRINGVVNFTSVTGPDTGRAGNQDGGSDKSTSRFTRLLAYDISLPLVLRPVLKAEFVVPLPQNSKANTLASSEIHFVSEGILLVLSRDGNGHGDDTTKSKFKSIDLIDIRNATDIHGSKFDSPTHPIAINGTLDSSITPAAYIEFLDMINTTQLARFGLHNGTMELPEYSLFTYRLYAGDPADATLIDAKWESIALAPVGDPKFPHDFFLFTAADNDFLTTQGISLGQPYNAGIDNDNQFMVYRVTLPTK
ncbi:hypothetical protein EW026_g830 [Hermanssonia centrifuga]|uniref:Phytase-like domain-containing protein n=1 Tax=Hermanssonia centrifuga TaxID=98765 RepID=A0A4S4KUI6_9APHY|nr:hypothetical protein EW026_g830 [Hermanssonia centrifuga]